jgi:hypothetical protein
MSNTYGFYLNYKIWHPEFKEFEKDMLWFSTSRLAYEKLEEFKREYGKNLKKAEILDIQDTIIEE